MSREVELIKKYINDQIQKVSNLDVAEGKKGVAITIVNSHKEGYLEALNNLKTLIEKNIR